MGDHIDLPIVGQSYEQRFPRKPEERATKSRKRVWISIGLLLVAGGAYAIIVEETIRNQFHRQTVGHCFKTGIGAVGMAVDTVGTTEASMIFPSGIRATYRKDELKGTDCPAS